MSSPHLQEMRRGGEFQSRGETARYLNPETLAGTRGSVWRFNQVYLPRHFFFFSSLKELIDDKVGNFINRIGRIAEFRLTSESREVAL